MAHPSHRMCLQPHGAACVAVAVDWCSPSSLSLLTGCLLLLLLQDGYTPLHGAAEGGRLEVVKALLGAGAAVDAVTAVQPPPLSSPLAQHHVVCFSASG